MRYLFSLILIAVAALTLNCDKKETKAVSANGKEVFKVHCQSCHGEWGQGDGPMSDITDQKPRNYVAEGFKNGYDYDSVVKSINNGFPDAGMPGYSQRLSEAEVSAVAKYILGLYAKH